MNFQIRALEGHVRTTHRARKIEHRRPPHSCYNGVSQEASCALGAADVDDVVDKRKRVSEDSSPQGFYGFTWFYHVLPCLTSLYCFSGFPSFYTGKHILTHSMATYAKNSSSRVLTLAHMGGILVDESVKNTASPLPALNTALEALEAHLGDCRFLIFLFLVPSSKWIMSGKKIIPIWFDPWHGTWMIHSV